jgi:hypothetical protein
MTKPERPSSASRQNDPSDDFQRQAKQRPPGLLAEFMEFLAENKKWWLAPILLVLLMISALVLLAGSGLAPLLYTLF